MLAGQVLETIGNFFLFRGVPNYSKTKHLGTVSPSASRQSTKNCQIDPSLLIYGGSLRTLSAPICDCDLRLRCPSRTPEIQGESEDIWGKRPFSSVFWIFQVLFVPSGKGRKRQKKGEKGRFRPISRKGGQTPLKPPFVTPPFAAAQIPPPRWSAGWPR